MTSSLYVYRFMLSVTNISIIVLYLCDSIVRRQFGSCHSQPGFQPRGNKSRGRSRRAFDASRNYLCICTGLGKYVATKLYWNIPRFVCILRSWGLVFLSLETSWGMIKLEIFMLLNFKHIFILL